MFGWPDPNTGFDQSEHALYTCYFIILNILDIFKLNTHCIGIFMYIYSRDLLPECFDNLFISKNQVHDHNTRAAAKYIGLIYKT